MDNRKADVKAAGMRMVHHDRPNQVSLQSLITERTY
jgi:hypothetical protein